ncbi:MAG: TRAP transporter small permease [Dehalococcoidales bacterium]|nr:TRAP transporter small permease [Dehalococcoidales bacterium]
MITTIMDVIGRFFHKPLPGTVEMNVLCLSSLSILSWAFIQMKKGHVSIDLFLNKMPPGAKHLVNSLTTTLALIFAILLSWRAIPMVLNSARTREWTDVIHLTVWPFKLLLALGVAILALQLIIDIYDELVKFRKRERGKVAISVKEYE